MRLREIGDRQEPDEPSNGPPAVGTPGGATPDGPPHAVADQSLAARASTTTTSQKPFKGTKKQSHSDAVRALGKTVRLRDKDHRKFVLRQPCLVCGRVPSDSHHLTFIQPRALGRRVSDEFTVPVCRSITASIIARATRPHGGGGSTLIRFQSRSSFGSRAGLMANCSSRPKRSGKRSWRRQRISQLKMDQTRAVIPKPIRRGPLSLDDRQRR